MSSELKPPWGWGGGGGGWKEGSWFESWSDHRVFWLNIVVSECSEKEKTIFSSISSDPSSQLI